MALDLASLDPSLLAPARPNGADRPGTHFVQLYEDELALLDTLQRFVSVGLESGEAALVLADKNRQKALDTRLHAAGVDIESLASDGCYISVDADELLECLMVDGVPNRALFAEVVGDLIETAALGGRKVRVFGELVAVLWARGNVAAAIRLEELWNDQSESHAFQLFCAYPGDLFDETNLRHISEVCRQHTHVILS